MVKFEYNSNEKDESDTESDVESDESSVDEDFKIVIY
jgi:hypothetical protein